MVFGADRRLENHHSSFQGTLVPNLNLTQADNQKETAHPALLAAFDSFFSVASFYPVDHGKCQAAVAEMRLLMKQLLGPNDSLVFEPYRGGILLQGHFVSGANPGAASIFSLLETLGVARFQFHCAAPLSELHQVVRILNTLRLESDSAIEFHRLDFSHFPRSAQIEQRDLQCVSPDSPSNPTVDSPSSRSLEELMGYLTHLKWDYAQKKEFQERMKALLNKIKDLNKNAPPTKSNSAKAEQPSPEELLAVSTTALRQASVLLSADDTSANVDQLFLHAAEALACSADSGAAAIMFETFQGVSEKFSAKNEDSACSQWRDDTVNYSESISDLATRVLQLSARSQLTTFQPGNNREEIWHIWIQLLTSGASESLNRKLRSQVKSYLAPPLDQNKLETAKELITSLVQNGDRKPIDAVMPLFLASLLRGYSEGFSLFLEELLPQTQPEKLALIWPHLVGLMLHPKPPTNPKIRAFLCQAIYSLPAEMLAAETHRLDFLPVIQKGKMGPALFQLPAEKTNRTLKALLEGRQSNQVGQQIYNQWKTKPVSSLACLLIRVLGPFENSHKSIYLGLLELEVNSVPEEGFKHKAEELILSALITKADSDRKAAWVKSAICELGRIGGHDSREFLTKIQTRKTLLFFKAWPQDCRDAAQDALEKLAQRSLPTKPRSGERDQS